MITIVPDNRTHSEWVLDMLQRGHSITPIDALHGCGCMRLSARIYDLRRAGYKIEVKREKKGKAVYARYYLKRGNNDNKA